MKVLSVTGFKNFYNNNTPAIFIFDTENQPNGDLEDVKTVQRYTNMACMLNPNRIMFANEQGNIVLNGVKCVRIYEGSMGYLVSIVVGNKNDSDNDMSYTFIMDIMDEV